MKKLILVATGFITLATSMTMTSCSKKGDYTCECTSSLLDTTMSYTETNVKKSDAQKNCDQVNATWQQGFDGSCSLK